MNYQLNMRARIQKIKIIQEVNKIGKRGTNTGNLEVSQFQLKKRMSQSKNKPKCKLDIYEGVGIVRS